MASSDAVLLTHLERDFRVRTLTTLLAALNCTIPTVNPSPILLPYTSPDPASLDCPEYPPDTGPINGTRTVPATLLRSMKLLNMMAQLFVRHHEIVAVIPKRTGPNATWSMVVSIDNGSSGDTEGQGQKPDGEDETEGQQQGKENKLEQEGEQGEEEQDGHAEGDHGSISEYLIVQNPRPASPPTSPAAVEELHAVTTMDQLTSHLYQYTQIPFGTHVACIELLFNRIIASCRLSTSSADKKTEVQMLVRYITFRAVPKMNRRFNSPEFQSFCTAMRRLTPQDISRVFPFTKPLALNQSDTIAFADILFYKSLNQETFPHLVEMYNQLDEEHPVLYSMKTAWEFHQLFLFVIQESMMAVAWLHQHTKAQKCDGTLAEISKGIRRAEHWMGFLNLLVHESELVVFHIAALEPVLIMQESAQDSWSQGNWIELPPTIPSKTDDTSSIRPPCSSSSYELQEARQEMEEDCGMSDIKLEVSTAALWHRAAQQCLWLSVSVQHAISVLTHSNALPQTPIIMTLLEAPDMNEAEGTMLENWESVIRGMYPKSIKPSIDSPEEAEGSAKQGTIVITDDEAVTTLIEYGKTHGGRYGKFLSEAGSKYKFRGRWHAEAFLATLRSLSVQPESVDSQPGQSPSIDILHKIRNTYRHIGVSKRCCSICTKIISLLSPKTTIPAVILSGHGNVYPTALPPFLPKAVAMEFILWLEDLVRGAVNRLVLKRRRTSMQSNYSAKSADSKAMSPDHEGSQDMSSLGDIMGVQLGAAQNQQVPGAPGISIKMNKFRSWSLDD